MNDIKQDSNIVKPSIKNTIFRIVTLLLAVYAFFHLLNQLPIDVSLKQQIKYGAYVAVIALFVINFFSKFLIKRKYYTTRYTSAKFVGALMALLFIAPLFAPYTVPLAEIILPGFQLQDFILMGLVIGVFFDPTVDRKKI